MRFFLDTPCPETVRSWVETGLVDGVTTNPTLIARSGRPRDTVITELCHVVPGPVSAEVLATETPGMLAEARTLRQLASNVVIKLPLTRNGLHACRILSAEGTQVNVTLCFSPLQALLAARAGATWVSPFVGRLDDTGNDGMHLIRDIVTIFRNDPTLKTRILAASLRHPQHVLECARAGVDVVTVPPAVLEQIIRHPMTDLGLAAFLRDAEQSAAGG